MPTMPVDKGFYVTSGFGPRWGTVHYGTDFGRDGGSGGHPVYAVKSGTVTAAGPASGFGQWVNVDHPASNGGGLTVYGHVIPEVKVGQQVAEGQRIARINPDSRTNGGVAPHLHLEWHRYTWSPPGGDRLDPMPLLAGARWPGDTSTAKPAPQPKETSVSYYDVDWSSKFHFGRPRPLSGLVGVCIHTTENDPGTPAENVANYQATSRTGSYNMLVDTTGKRLRENTDDWQVWASGNKGNDILLHLSFVFRAHYSRTQWLAQDKMLRAGATVVAHWCRKYGFPVRHVGVGALPGITTHDATRAWGGTDHTDPGPNFPWDVFLRYVNESLNPAAAPAPKEGPLMALSDAEQRELLAKVRDIHRELTQKYPSRSAYRRNENPVDTLAGMLLNVDGRIHESWVHERAAEQGVTPDEFARQINGGSK